MKLATAVFASGIALAIAGTALLVHELSRTERPGALAGLTDRVVAPKAKLCDKAPALTAPPLGKFYDYARGLALAWKPDAIAVRLDNLAMSSPLGPDGTSRLWTAGFYSPSAGASILVHSGDGTVNCTTVKGQIAGSVPKLKGEPMRDGVALYKVAEKHGKPLLAKGLGVGINLWASGDDNHATWQIGFYDKQGYASGPRVILNASTGAVEEVVKAR
jgi:hypothetical protein